VDLLIEKIKAETLREIKVKNNRTLDYTIIERTWFEFFDMEFV